MSDEITLYWEIQRAREAYVLEIQPLVNLLVELDLIMPRRIILQDTGEIEYPENQSWPQWALDYKNNIEEIIKKIAYDYNIKLQS